MEDFRKSDPWRVFRIQSELVEGFEILNEIGPAVSIFGSSRMQPGSFYYEKAVELGGDADAGNPQLAHGTFTDTPVAEREGHGAVMGFTGGAQQVFASAPVAFGLFKQPVLASPRGWSVGGSWHWWYS